MAAVLLNFGLNKQGPPISVRLWEVSRREIDNLFFSDYICQPLIYLMPSGHSKMLLFPALVAFCILVFFFFFFHGGLSN